MTSSGGKQPSNLGKVKKAKNEPSEGLANNGGNFMEAIADKLFRYWKYLIPIFASIFAFTLYKGSNNAISNLINAEDKLLKNAIFGEQPYLFYCDRNVPGGNSQGSANLQGLPGLFTHLNTIKGNDMGFAVVNCSQKLPSGKTLIERFGLKDNIKPLLWGNAPWLLKPIQLLPKHMKDVTTMNKYVDDLLLSPKSIVLKSDKQFHKVCEFSKSYTNDDRDITPTCVIMIKGEKYQQHVKIQNELEKRLILEYPKTRFVMIDGKQHRLSFEDVEDMPYDQFGLKVHAVRNGTHYLSMVNPITWDYLNTFVSTAVSSPLYSYNEHKDDDMVRILKPSIIAKKQAKKRIMEEKKKKKAESTKASKAKTSKTTSESAQKPQKAKVVEDKKTAPKKKTEEEAEEVEEEEFDEEEELDLDGDKPSKDVGSEQEEQDPETLRKEQLERERRRREEMEQQAKAHVFESREEEEDNSDSDDDDDGEDDSVIEL